MDQLTDGDIDEFREIYIRDKVYAKTSDLRPLSPYNRTQGVQFFSDVQLRLIDARIRQTFASFLEGVYAQREAADLSDGKAANVAAVNAAGDQRTARLIVLRRECHRLMAEDGGVLASLVMGGDKSVAAATTKKWADDDEADLMFWRGKSPVGGTIEFKRE